MPRDLTTLLHDTAVAPAERPDVNRLVQRGRRRRRTRHVVASTAAAGALVGVAMVGASLLATPQPPTVADQPDQPEQSFPEHIEIPEGWTTVIAGDLALSVPPDWSIAFTNAPGSSSDDGTCRIAIPPPEDSPQPDGLDGPAPPAGGVMVDLGPPVQSPCSPRVLDTPAVRPTVWLLDASRSGEEVADAQKTGEPVRLGTVDAWRVDRSPFVQFVGDNVSGVVWAAPAGHSDLDAVLRTVRRATHEERARFAQRVSDHWVQLRLHLEHAPPNSAP
jgi:hypothetical protein